MVSVALDDHPDALVSVLRHLDCRDLCRAAETSHTWQQQADDAARIKLREDLVCRRLPCLSAEPLRVLGVVELVQSKIELHIAIEDFVNGLWRSAVRRATAQPARAPRR